MLEEVHEIYLKCKEDLLKKNILQWDDHYPDKNYFQECIENKVLMAFMEDETILGHVVLSEWQSDEWKVMSWTGIRPIVIHSLMIQPFIQGKGIGTRFVKLCEEYAIDQGYDSIRLDAFAGNAVAIHLYEKLDYQKKGSVYFASKPEGHQEYMCFEKLL
ncbi:hypothetical protein LD39_01380 [Halobacillus sp. BBL2006]|nr:hypothetical protein LD39_01380 [Halobacillus sp. BBL2006]